MSDQKKAKDYSQYFDFTDARIVSEDDEKKVVKIKGREITIYDQPTIVQVENVNVKMFKFCVRKR